MELGYSLSQLNKKISHGVCSEKLTELTEGDSRDIYNSMFSMVSIGNHDIIGALSVRTTHSFNQLFCRFVHQFSADGQICDFHIIFWIV